MADNKMADNKMADNKMADNKMADNKMADNKMADNKLITSSTYNCKYDFIVMFITVYFLQFISSHMLALLKKSIKVYKKLICST